MASHHVVNEYLSILSAMDPGGKSCIIPKYIEELKHYESSLIYGQKERILREADDRIIGLLRLILKDGALQLDVAFCMVLSIIHCVQKVTFAMEYIAFALYFVLGSCFPCLRPHFTITDPDHPDHHIYKHCAAFQYLMDTYFAKLNDKKCIKFKYHGNQSTYSISCALRRYTALHSPIICIICDYVQYPHQEFIDFLNDFMWHFPYCETVRMECKEWIDFVFGDDASVRYGYLLPCVLGIHAYMDNEDHNRLHYEAQGMLLAKLSTAEEISWYLKRVDSCMVRCYANPPLFIELFESIVSNPWRLLRDAIVNHSVSIFFNGHHEQEHSLFLHRDEAWCKKKIWIVLYTIKHLVRRYFDSNDKELMRHVVDQLTNSHALAVQLQIECEAKEVLIQVLSEAMFVLQIPFFSVDMKSEAPPRKKRRIDNEIGSE
eukprot:570899_1